MLGFLRALQEKMKDEAYPDFGSAIVMEVYQETDESKGYSIRFLYKAASQTSASYIPLTKPSCEQQFTGEAAPAMGGFHTEEYHCILADLVVWATGNTLMVAQDWCHACSNESADVCLQARYNNNAIQQAFADLQAGFGNPHDKVAIIGGTFFGGLVLGLFIMGASCSICRMSRSSNEKTLTKSIHEADSEQPPIPPVMEQDPAAVNAEIN